MAHPDGAREIRAICMAALPCPPLPIMATLEDGDGGESNTTCGDAVGNSHDFISHLMNVRAAAEQQDVNEARRRVQVHSARRGLPPVPQKTRRFGSV